MPTRRSTRSRRATRALCSCPSERQSAGRLTTHGWFSSFSSSDRNERNFLAEFGTSPLSVLARLAARARARRERPPGLLEREGQGGGNAVGAEE